MNAKFSLNRFLQIFVFVLMLPFTGLAQQVEVKNNSFYIDGQKFFVKGIGYPQGEMPGMVPWARPFDAELLHFDMKRILSGGFNTIRTWSALTTQELDVIQQYDLKIIMGIWIDPYSWINFAEQAFVDQAKKYVTDVVSYSKNYDNIIAYLIMNEPSLEAIAMSGYDKTVDLWSQLIDIIHAQHPNRPVSISGSSYETFINPDVFDFSAYNVYFRDPVTVNYLHRYRDFIQYLKKLRHNDAPLIITEYGLSVSPTGPGKWGYGGNTLNDQKDGDLYMYKALVDGGAAGSCIFNYSDGWWKGGNEFVHDNHPEEWFGLVNYTGLSDKFGEVRPVWEAVKAYQSALITQPRSSEVYPVKVPVEVFLNDTIKRIEIMLDNQQVYDRQNLTGYLLDTLQFDVQDMKDALLVFNCYDAVDNLVKKEEKSILITTKELVLPSIRISIANANVWQDNFVDVQYQVNKSPVFNTSSRLDGIFFLHDGYEYKYVVQLPSGEQMNFTRHHDFQPNKNVFTVGAAFDVTYNSFTKRIVNQLTLSRINETVSGEDETIPVSFSLQIYPNPTTNKITISTNRTLTGETRINIISMNAQQLMQASFKNQDKFEMDVSKLRKGVYLVKIQTNAGIETKKLVIQ